MTQQIPNLAALTQRARPDVVSAIRQASAQTGVDFAYLLEKAAAESSFDPKAQAQTASARGLYQFVDRTWLDAMDKHGAAHGYPNVAAAITRDAHGNPVVANGQAREYILALRENPRISALMAAEFAQENQQVLEQSLGREVGNAELYMAHFLGAGGAAKFLGQMETNGEVAACDIVPAAAQANASVFYDGGKALSLDDVFKRFAGKFSEDFGEVRQQTAVMDATGGDEPEAAIIAASTSAPSPSLAALQGLQPAPERVNPLRPDLATQLFTLSLLQAVNVDEKPSRDGWIA